MNNHFRKPSEADLQKIRFLTTTPEAQALALAIRNGKTALVKSLIGSNTKLLNTIANTLAEDEAEYQKIKEVFPTAIIEYASGFPQS